MRLSSRCSFLPPFLTTLKRTSLSFLLFWLCRHSKTTIQTSSQRPKLRRLQRTQSKGTYPLIFDSFTPCSLKRPFSIYRCLRCCVWQCDASGSNSCTECRTRNIPCRFTREHMRRLTSIKFLPSPFILEHFVDMRYKDKFKTWNGS